MDTSTLKGLEFLIIVGAVAWFYLSQTRNLKQLKEEREAKAQKESAPESRNNAPETGNDGGSG